MFINGNMLRGQLFVTFELKAFLLNQYPRILSLVQRKLTELF